MQIICCYGNTGVDSANSIYNQQTYANDIKANVCGPVHENLLMLFSIFWLKLIGKGV